MSEEKKLEEIPAPAQDLTDEEAEAAKGGLTKVGTGTLILSGGAISQHAAGVITGST